MSPFWDVIRNYWAEGTPAAREALRPFTTLAATKSQYLDGVADPSWIDPAAWTLDQALLNRPGNAEIELDLLYDDRTNVALYPAFQTCFRTYRPPTLVAWGANDPIFPPPGARASLRDLPDAELHLLDSGPFALEDKLDHYMRLIRDVLDRVHGGPARA